MLLLGKYYKDIRNSVFKTLHGNLVISSFGTVDKYPGSSILNQTFVQTTGLWGQPDCFVSLLRFLLKDCNLCRNWEPPKKQECMQWTHNSTVPPKKANTQFSVEKVIDSFQGREEKQKHIIVDITLKSIKDVLQKLKTKVTDLTIISLDVSLVFSKSIGDGSNGFSDY